jgi:hypothetical protein
MPLQLFFKNNRTFLLPENFGNLRIYSNTEKNDDLQSNFLSGRIFKGIDDIFNHGVKAWRELNRETIKSICAGAPI